MSLTRESLQDEDGARNMAFHLEKRCPAELEQRESAGQIYLAGANK